MPHRFLRSDSPYSIFRLPEALTCWQAVAVMAASYFAAGLLMVLGGMLAQTSFIFPALFGLVAFVILLAGTSGAGVCLTDLARQRAYRGSVSYFIAGLFSLPKLVGAGLLMGLASLGVMLGMALVLLVCKLPGIGPLLLVVAIPVLVLAMALMLVGYYVTSSIVGPALWDGERVMHSLSIAWAITRRYPFAAIGKIIGGLMLSGIFASLLVGLLTVSSLVVGGMATPIVGGGTLMGPLMGMGMGSLMRGAANGHLVGAGIGYALVFMTAAAFVFLMPLMVGVLTWCEFSEKVDLAGIRSTTDAKLKDVNAKVAEMKEKANSPAAVAPAAQAATTAAPATAPLSIDLPIGGQACPKCQGEVQDGDRFCEHCGHKLF